MDFDEQRLNLFNTLKITRNSENKLFLDKNVTFSQFFNSFFNTQKSFEDFYDALSANTTKSGKPFVDFTLKTFYENFSCDRNWAKTITYCGGSSSAQPAVGGNTQTQPITGDWDKCAKDIGGKMSSDDSSITYTSKFKNYGVVTLFKDHTFTSTGPKYTKGKWSCIQPNTLELDPIEDSKQQGEGISTSFGTDTNITANDIKSGSLVKYGMKGPIVGEIQNKLINHGFKNISKSGKPDNIFGSRTKNMVVGFQRSKGLKDDGIVGPKTWKELEKEPSTSQSKSTPYTKNQLDPMASGKVPFSTGIEDKSENDFFGSSSKKFSIPDESPLILNKETGI